MKINKTFLITTISLGIFLLSGCTLTNNNNQNQNNNNNTNQNVQSGNNQAAVTGNYVGSFYKDNYVWGGAMNLAWTEMSENIIKALVKLNTTDPTALAMVDKFNNAVFTKNDLDEASYYIKSGYGQSTVDMINKESRAKFPSKSFSDLNLTLAPSDFIAYAYFLKQVEYQTQFEEKDVQFNGQTVKGFHVKANTDQRNNIQVLQYTSDDKFIIALHLKDDGDQLILAKGYNTKDPTEVVNAVRQVANEKVGYGIADQEKFEMPKLHLDYSRSYQELINKSFANQGFAGYLLSQMFENIKFDMDQKGARVENEAGIFGVTSLPVKPPVIRNFILDKPFWVVMKRTSSQNPYFLLGVNNDNLMIK